MFEHEECLIGAWRRNEEQEYMEKTQIWSSTIHYICNTIRLRYNMLSYIQVLFIEIITIQITQDNCKPAHPVVQV